MERLGPGDLSGSARARPLHRSSRTPHRGPPPQHAASRFEWGIAGALLGAVAVWVTADAWALSHSRPLFVWDGLSIWLLRGKVLGMSAEFPTALFREADLIRSHWDYPLVLPAFTGWVWRRGGQSPQAAFALGPLLATGLFATALPLTRHLRPPLAAAIALAPLTLDQALILHLGGYADPLLVVLGTAGFAWTATAILTGDRSLLIAASLPLAAAVGTKNEGAALVFAIGLAGLALIPRQDRSRQGLACWAAALAPAAAWFVLWRIAVASLGTGSDLAIPLSATLVAERLPSVTAVLAAVLAASPAHVVAAAAVLLALALTPRRDRRLVVGRMGALLLAPAIYTVVLVGVYVGTPHDLAWHLEMSASRVVMILAPWLAIAAILPGALPAPRLAEP